MYGYTTLPCFFYHNHIYYNILKHALAASRNKIVPYY